MEFALAKKVNAKISGNRMNIKLILGIFLPSLVIISLVVLSSSNVGFSVLKETVKSVKFDSLFIKEARKGSPLLQVITIKNNFFIPRRFELPRLIACLNDKDGLNPRENVEIKYIQGYSSENNTHIFDDIVYNSYFPTQSIEISDGEMYFSVIARPRFSYSHFNKHSDYVNSLFAVKDYDELLLIKSKGSDNYYNSCADLDEKKLKQAVHIEITEKLTEPSVECKDSDNGINYYIKGSALGISSCLINNYMPQDCPAGIETKTDYCESITGKDIVQLVEYFCGKDKRIGFTTYICPNGCSNGSCIGKG